jgi:nucleoside-diphosphate-sugar epimerase
METALITGVAGFIGSSLAEKLLKDNFKVIGIDSFTNYYSTRIKEKNIENCLKHPNFSFIRQDLDTLDLSASVEKTDYFFHLSAQPGVRASWGKEFATYVKNNISVTQKILESLKNSTRLKKFVFASSSSVYGRAKYLPIDEKHPTNPISPYAATKKACELLAYTYHSIYSISVSCLRFFTVYGPRQRPDMAIHKFTRLIMQNKPIPMYGDGTTERDYTYCTDIIDGIVAALDADLGFEIINLGESNVVALRDMIGLIETHVGKKAVIEQLPEQPGDVKITYADVGKAKRLLGYSPSVHIDEGIKNFVGWYKKNF